MIILDFYSYMYKNLGISKMLKPHDLCLSMQFRPEIRNTFFQAVRMIIPT